MNTVIVRNDTGDDHTLEDLQSFSVVASGTVDLLDYFKAEEIARSDDLLLCLAEGKLVVDNSGLDLTVGEAIRYVSLHKHINPQSPDGREIIRADSRPTDTETYFSGRGDTASGIGDGAQMIWDFSDSNTVFYTYDPTSNGPRYDGFDVAQIDITYTDPIYIKEGAIYFYDAPWQSFIAMLVVVPAGNYYPNPYGPIPASALGLSGVDMYAYSYSDVYYTHYTNMHHMYGSCPMGDELNSEGCSMNSMPPGWLIRVLVGAPTGEGAGDPPFRGYAYLEMYRERTVVLPGGSI